MRDKSLDFYYERIITEATKAAEKALWECKPTPQTFYSADLSGRPINDERFYSEEGDCGGAYINGISGHEPFVKWAKKKYGESLVSKDVYKGYTLSVPYRKFEKVYSGQSAERYEAAARAFAEVLKQNGISCGVRAYLT